MDVTPTRGSAAASRVSVVVAHPRVDPTLRACLAAHLDELEPGDELLVVLAESAGSELEQDPGRVRVIVGTGRELVPELWLLGLREARGDTLRVTTGSFVPLPGWRAALLRAHASGAVAVGGAVLPAPELRASGWAIFFQRYRAFRPPFPAREVSDVPGDHASYRREALDETAELWQHGFWERDVNRELHRRGRKLVLDPTFRATYAGGESPRRFLAQRFRHGIQFGRERLRGAGAGRRVLFVGAFLLPGAVFAARIARESLARPGSLAPFLRAIPWLLAFVSAWSCGEWIGALRGPPAGNERAR